MKRVISKLSNWKVKNLSVGGRLTLLNSILGALPTYYFSLYKALMGVLSKLESIRNNFFTGADLGENKMIWVSWNKVMTQKQFGGLGVSRLFALNKALLFK